MHGGRGVWQAVISLPFVWLKLKINPINHVNIEITISLMRKCKFEFVDSMRKTGKKINMMLPTLTGAFVHEHNRMWLFVRVCVCVWTIECQTMTAFKHTRRCASMSAVRVCLSVCMSGCRQRKNAENSKIYRKAKGNMWECNLSDNTTD